MTKKQKKVLRRIILAAVLMIAAALLPVEGALRFALFMVPYLIIGYDILIRAAKGIRNLQPFDENFLMAVATVGAIVLGDYTEGVAVMLFYQIGELFQSYAVGKTPPSLDKQYVRDWLDSINFNHQPPGPVLPDDVIARTREIYLKAFKDLSGREIA